MSSPVSSWSSVLFRGLTSGCLSRQTILRGLLLAVAITGLSSLFPKSADAQYTVYIYNTRRSEGWIRSGFAHDVYTSYARCRSSIVSRVSENRRYRTDFEAFAIVRHSSRPPAGALRNYVSATIIYIPGRGYLAAAGAPQNVDRLCLQRGPAWGHSEEPLVGKGRGRIPCQAFLPVASDASSRIAAESLANWRPRSAVC